ncbi:MAG: hypothetical protein IT184_16450 [Acidobacteria bacterium]|nr:hypothetical protein [Acidobacteriota bacterium]
MLTLTFRPDARPPKPVPDLQRRIEHFIETLSAERSKIIVPAPVLGEFLVLAGDDGPEYLAQMADNVAFDIQPFDTRAAIEAASLMRKARDAGNKRGGATGAWQKVKVDWQLVAIAKVNQVDCVYSNDGDLVALCATAGLTRKGLDDLPPPPPQQLDLPATAEPPQKPRKP